MACGHEGRLDVERIDALISFLNLQRQKHARSTERKNPAEVKKFKKYKEILTKEISAVNHGTRKGANDARAPKAVTSHIFAEQAPSDASARAWKPPSFAFANLKSINVDIDNLIPSQRRSQGSSGGLDKL